MAAIRIQVGVATGRDLSTAFEPLVQSMQRARAQVETMSKAMANAQKAAAKVGTDAQSREADRAAKAAQKAFAQIAVEADKAAAREIAAADRASQAKVRAEQRAFDQKIRNAERAAASFERTLNREVAAAERAAAREGRISARADERRGRAIARDSYQTMGSIARGAAGYAGQFARGAGAHLDIGSNVANAMELQKQVTQIVNAGYIPGQAGPAGTRQDPAAVMGDIKSAADATGMSRGDAAEGLQKFVAKSGNLQLGRDVLADMARLAMATGSSMSDVVSAAGELGAALEHSKNPAKDIMMVMRALGGQGQLGAVDMPDQAKYLGRLAAAGPQFEGGVAGNIQTMGVLAQLARQRGGAASAAEAFTSVSSFVGGFKKNARREAFANENISLEGQGGLIRDPLQIIKEAIFKTGADPSRLGKMFMDVRQAKPMEALANVYRQAGGGAKGEAAVEAELKRLGGAMMSDAQIAQALGERMKDSSTKVQLFNNKMEDVAERVASRLLPSLEKAAPAIEAIAVFAGKAAAFAAENPGTAIVAAITASIAKAAIGESVGRSISGAISGSGSSIAGPVGAAIASVLIGIQLRKMYDQHKKEEVNKDLTEMDSDKLGVVKRKAGWWGKDVYRRRVRGEDGQFTTQESETNFAQAGMRHRIGGAAFELFSKAAEAVPQGGSAGSKDTSMAAFEAEIAAMQKASDDARNELASKLDGTLRVEVTNMPDNFAGAGNEGRTDSGDKVVSPE